MGGGGQILHCQLDSTILHTHHKKFQLNRSRSGQVIKNSKNVWVDQEAMFDEREAMVWWWIPSKNLVTSDRLVIRESVGFGQRGSDNFENRKDNNWNWGNLKLKEYLFF